MSHFAAWAIAISLAYLGLLFALASFGDRRAEQGRSVIANPYIYTLSLAVYCTAWTYFGSVGVAASQGVAFLPVYLGPTLLALLFLGPVRKILLIAKAYGITSIADFASARYGKSGTVAGLVTIVALLGSIPYISLQLKAVATGIELLFAHDGVSERGRSAPTARFWWRSCSLPLASSSAPVTSMRPSIIRAWCSRSRSRASSNSCVFWS